MPHGNSSESKFERGLAYLRDYKASHGHCAIPQAYRAPDGFPLGVWSGSQRTAWRNGKLSPSRIEALRGIGLEPNAMATLFPAAVERLKRYKDTFGHTKVPGSYVSMDGFALGQWLAIQRRAHMSGKLGDERGIAMEAVGCDLDHDDKPKFEKGLGALLAFRKRKGDLDVPELHVKRGFALGKWLRERKTHIGSGNAPAYQAVAFRKHGIPFRKPAIVKTPEQSVSQALERIAAFKDTFGHVRVPTPHRCDDGFKLGEWLANTRHRWRKGVVSAELAAKLENLGIMPVWPPHEEMTVPSTGEADLRLNETAAPVQSPADNDAECQPSDLGVPLDAVVGPEVVKTEEAVIDATSPMIGLGDFFRRSLEHLETFEDEFGHTNVPSHYVTADGFRLGTWVQTQRAVHRSGKMPGVRIAALLALDFDFDQNTGHKESFHRGIASLLAFRRREGHFDVPRSHVEEGHNLGTWLPSRWAAIKSGKAPQYQIDAFREHGIPMKREEPSCPPVDHRFERKETGRDRKSRAEAEGRLSSVASEALGKLANWADDELMADASKVKAELGFLIGPMVRERFGSLSEATPIMAAIDFDSFARRDGTMMDAIWKAAEDWILQRALSLVDDNLSLQQGAPAPEPCVEPRQVLLPGWELAA